MYDDVYVCIHVFIGGYNKVCYGNSVFVTCTRTCVHKIVKILLKSVKLYL